MPTSLVFDHSFLDHDTGLGHPERPDRLRAIERALGSEGLLEKMVRITCSPAPVEAIDAVHVAGYRRRIEQLSERGGGSIDADTVVSAKSYSVAMLAAGGVIAAVDAVMSGECDNAFCAIRPPGHHAESARPMGFCLFNNVAIAARHLQSRHGIERVMIVDWDVHHGNGTQEIFEADPSVLYVSLHQWPLYPGSGARSERGVGAGEGTTLNIPMRGGSGDEEYLKAFDEVIEAGRAFRPDFLLVSAGFDAHSRDPLAGMVVSADGFRRMTRSMTVLAGECCRGRIVTVLEGGYDLEGLSEGVVAMVRELLAAPARTA